MTDTIIFDIDGVLSDPRHRLHHITGKKKDYKAFFDAMRDDGPIEPVVKLVRLIQTSKIEHVFVTGRPESHRAITGQWLERLRVQVAGRLYMRKTGDHRPDDIVKREILDQIRADGFNPVLAIEDRPRVVKMWRDAGIICLQNEWHGDESITPGETIVPTIPTPGMIERAVAATDLSGEQVAAVWSAMLDAVANPRQPSTEEPTDER